MSESHFSKSVLINKDDAVLVVIDMQEKLFRVMSKRESLMSNVVKLVKFARIMNIPVVATEQEKLGETLYVIREDLPNYNPVTKLSFNCFGAEGFREQIERTKRRSLILTGIESHICVAQTALHALSDYNVHVVSDAISSRSPGDYEVAIRRMRHEGATITSTEMVMYEIMEKAGTDVFKEVLKLVK